MKMHYAELPEFEQCVSMFPTEREGLNTACHMNPLYCLAWWYITTYSSRRDFGKVAPPKLVIWLLIRSLHTGYEKIWISIVQNTWNCCTSIGTNRDMILPWNLVLEILAFQLTLLRIKHWCNMAHVVPCILPHILLTHWPTGCLAEIPQNIIFSPRSISGDVKGSSVVYIQ